jgi:hypothetical protein
MWNLDQKYIEKYIYIYIYIYIYTNVNITLMEELSGGWKKGQGKRKMGGQPMYKAHKRQLTES